MSYKPKGFGNDISGFYMPAVNRSKNDFMGAFGNDDRPDLLSESYEKNRHLLQEGFVQGRDFIYTFESEKNQSKHNERGKSHSIKYLVT